MAKKDFFKLSVKKNFQLLALSMMSLAGELLLYIITLYLARGVGEGDMFYMIRDGFLIPCAIGFVFLLLYSMAVVSYLFNRVLEANDTIVRLEKQLDLMKETDLKELKEKKKPT